jgi:hypothetical protein
LATKKTSPTWSEVKTKLADFNRAGLLALIQGLYAASKDNQVFLHVRLHLGDDPLKPYKATISRWINPDIMKNQDISVSKAKKAISDYKKAIGQPDGMAELSVYYCEQIFGFLGSCGMDDESYFSSLVRMFEQAIKSVMALPDAQPPPYINRLDPMRAAGHNIGWGVGDDFDELWWQAGLADES